MSLADPGGRDAAADIDALLGGAPPLSSPAAHAGGKPEDVVARRLAVLVDFWGHEDPGVFAWQDAKPATRHAALVRVQRFTEWLIATFDVREIKPCWVLHPAVVAELWALERLHHATHTVTTDPSAPVVFYNQVPTTRARLRTDTGMDSCTATEHTVQVREVADRVQARRASYDTSERWTASWAWPQVDDAGEAVPAPAHANGGTR
ncbi:hypothetical protein [Cellulomonas sp. RIT-PI-Y]|uniref:hypothetical protein n=1 Tax=Cellulomonas sp. RIT-PI-Y TaxID=3035297 RepID=UPI0021DA7420|nr:hypothetical protein [Cellulomonas sp. RIT-PI-Y]